MSFWVLTANLVGWPVIHLTVSFIFTRMPSKWFSPRSQVFCGRNWERGGLFYIKYFKVKSWKSKLPDAASWFDGGFPKKKLLRRDETYLRKYQLETCRGEAAHWATMFCCPIFFVWNPLWASLVMAGYSVVSNLPCIITQRYNRAIIEKLCLKGHRVRV